ncbi:tetratricopeptide repeat-containing sulfotransferase family protein [Sphingosinicella xenopeptidilytica]|uniref:Tetratricopeptide repeat-containing sulfotransferase family protein n=1 Tax=Sphingosinicella xenopeptidilytica TaxID=364098 RepID=A0ABW3C030_SPHXN
MALYQRGDLEAARELGEKLLGSRSDSPALLHLVGVLCCQTDRLDRGILLLERSLRQAPNDMTARLNLVRALVDAGKPEQAEAICAGGDAEADPEWLRLHGDILKSLRRFDEAARAYEATVSRNAENFEAWNNLGNVRLETGDTGAAITAFERAKALKPEMVVIRINLAKALATAGRYPESIAELQKAVEIAPQDTNALLELGRLLNRAGQSDEALALLGSAARLDRKNPEVFVAIGLTFAQLGEIHRAEQAYRFAIEADPSFAQAYVNLGLLLEQSNRVDQLDQLIATAKVSRIARDELTYLQALSQFRKGQFREALEAVQSTDSESIDTLVREQLIGQLADRLGDADTAFAAFTSMNRAMARDPAALPFDGTEHTRFVESLTAVTTPEWYARWPQLSLESTPSTPVFLVGFPRSGTTLLDTVLMGHPDTHVLEEEPLLARVRDMLGGIERLHDVGVDEANALRSRYFEELDSISPAAPGKLVIDKLPLNILRTPLIHRLFPDAKFIFAARHPCDAVLSCFMQNFKINQAMATFLDIRNASLFYDRTLGYWDQCQRVFPLNVHIVRYESMVADMEVEVRALIDFLGLPWDDRVLDYQRTAADRGYIRTPSYAQVTERVYSRAKGRWERYRAHLQDVLPILSPWAEKLGYGPVLPVGGNEGAGI